MNDPLTNATMRRLFGLAKTLMPRASSEDRHNHLRDLAAEVNGTGEHSVKSLEEFQARIVVAKLKRAIDDKRNNIRKQWQDEVVSLQPMQAPFATRAQWKRLVHAAASGMVEPRYALGALKKIRNAPTSWEFAVSDFEIRGLLKMFEEQRSHRKDHRYNSDTGEGDGPVSRRRRRRTQRRTT